MTQQANMQRKLIFLSHANPEDNDFTLWLAARLASAGYLVWSDLTKLIGGETFWDSIETAIRQHSAKVVSLFSKVSVQKKGFKDELSLALAVEKKLGLADFVIPLRLDDLDFSDFPPEIIRRNAIDFSSVWQDGLGRLLKKLEVDGVPRTANATADALSDWSRSLLRIDAEITTEKETLLSNWLEVAQVPPAINVSRIRKDAAPVTVDLLPWPAEIKGEFCLSFARLDRDEPTRFEHLDALNLQDYLEGRYETLFTIGRQDAHNIFVSLLRRAWDRHMKNKGLLGQIFARGRVGYYLPVGDGDIKRTRFVGPSGIAGSRALHGYSPKRSVYWHYAPELFPVLGRSLRFSFTPHVIFSEDGREPLTDAARAHRIRRSFCKSWWQDRWRDLMLAYLAHVAGDKETIELPLSESLNLGVKSRPVMFTSPVTAALPTNEQASPDTAVTGSDDQDDAVDDDDPDEELSVEGYRG
ncbi:MAG: toll/interleukin-1 receptor domain-containing protein [Gammaproteobacteria bacterium]|nr:MAG: toll/interleukin-1 receptor domain-containing protein [Gammaproteobacteria bacterium]